MKPDTNQLRTLRRRDPALAAVMRRMPAFSGYPDGTAYASRTYFHSLVRSVIFQMLTGKAAETIYGRVRAITPGSGFPTAKQLVNAGEARLRSCGLSGGKTHAILELSERTESGRLKLSGLHRRPDEEVIKTLTEIRGIGAWTAQMFLMFRLGRLDVLPVNDMGIQEGIRRLDGLRERPGPARLRGQLVPVEVVR